MAGGDQRVELTAADPLKESQRVENLARSYGGVALPASPEGNGLRVLIQIPAAQAQAFMNACRQPGLEPESAVTASPANSQARVLVEIVIIKAAS